MHLITPSLPLDNAFGRKRFKIVQCSILQTPGKFCISGSCDEAMLPDILQDEFLQVLPVPLTRSIEIDTLSALQISANTYTHTLGSTEIHPVESYGFRTNIILICYQSGSFHFG